MNTTNKPTHIGIIPDGNRRWAVEKGKSKIQGHTEGAKNIRRIVETAIKHQIPHLTIWLYSTENLLRGKTEVAHLLYLSAKITDYIPDMMKLNIRVQFVGDLERLPKRLQTKFDKVEKETKDNTGITLTFACGYGGRDDMIRATRRAIEDGLNSKQITEDTFGKYVDLGDAPDFELVIRTGGRSRMSGFFPWQTVYSEWYFTDMYWPAFDEKEFEKALEWFDKRERTRGK